MLQKDNFSISIKPKAKCFVLRGKVKLKIRDGELEADSVSIDSSRQEIYAEGGVEYRDGQAKVNGERFLYDIKLNQGVVYNSKLSVYPSFFIGQKLKRLDEKRYLWKWDTLPLVMRSFLTNPFRQKNHDP